MDTRGLLPLPLLLRSPKPVAVEIIKKLSALVGLSTVTALHALLMPLWPFRTLSDKLNILTLAPYTEANFSL